MSQDISLEKFREYNRYNTQVAFHEYKNIFDIIDKMEVHFKENYRVYNPKILAVVIGMTCKLFINNSNDFIKNDKFTFMDFVYDVCESNNWEFKDKNCTSMGAILDTLSIDFFKDFMDERRKVKTDN